MAWLDGWVKRVKLTIDQNDIDAALSNFPILIHLSTSSGRNSDDVSCVFDELAADANRKKIAVTTSDGVTQCYVEIEKWDDANEQAWLWVKVPSVASGADTDLYLYYDNTKADNTTYVGDPSDAVVHNVWDANHKLVTHMRDDPDTSHIRDSTVNANDGTKKAAGEPVVTASGQMDDAQLYDIDDFLNINTVVGDIAASTVGTLSAWAKPVDATPANAGAIVGLGDTDVLELIYMYIETDGKLKAFCYDAGAAQWGVGTDGAVFSDGVSLRVTLVHNGVIPVLLVNGVAVAQSFLDETDKTKWFADLAGIDNGRIGTVNAAGGGELAHFVGTIDEVRISVTNRTVAWEKASYESERDHLLDFGSEERRVIGPFPTHFVIR